MRHLLFALCALLCAVSMAEAASRGGAPPDVVDHVALATNYTKGSYNAYAAQFDTSGLTKGADYDANWTLNAGTFPNNTNLDWSEPSRTPTTGIWGYHHIDYVPATPKHVSSLNSFSVTFDWSFTGSMYFNLLTEFYLTTSAMPGNTQPLRADRLLEIGVLLHAPASTQSFHNGGTLVGTHVNNGVTYSVRNNAGYVTFLPSGACDVLTGIFDLKAALGFLQAQGLVSGAEYINGHSFGIEPTVGGGTGRFTVNSLAVIFQ